MPFTIAAVLSNLHRSIVHKRADPASRLQHARSLQFRIDLRDRVRIYLQLHCQLPDGWQLIADAQLPRGDRELNRPLQLVIKRGWVFGVYVEHRLHHCTTTIEQVGFQKSSTVCLRLFALTEASN